MSSPADVVSRIVDENVDRAKVRWDGFEKSVNSRMVRHVELKREGERTERPGQSARGLAVDIRKGDACASFDERGGDRLADAARRPPSPERCVRLALQTKDSITPRQCWTLDDLK
jgi:hypothetical protein